MKTKKTILAVAALTAVIIALSAPVAVYATDELKAAATQNEPTEIPDEQAAQSGSLGFMKNEVSENSEAENLQGSFDNATQESPSDTEISMLFEDIYFSIMQNADKIFSALAFAASLIVGLTYKKGLLPMLGGAVSSLKGSVEKIQIDTDARAITTDGKIGVINDSILKIKESVYDTEVSVSRINDRLDEYDRAVKQYEAMRTLLSSQIDMLYSIFTSSALPEYKKEEIGIRINEMKKELQINEFKEE